MGIICEINTPYNTPYKAYMHLFIYDYCTARTVGITFAYHNFEHVDEALSDGKPLAGKCVASLLS